MKRIKDVSFVVIYALLTVCVLWAPAGLSGPGGGAGGVSNPLTADLAGGGYDLTGVGVIGTTGNITGGRGHLQSGWFW